MSDSTGWQDVLESDEISFRQQVDGYTRHWIWYLIIMVVSVGGMFTYLRYYTTPSFSAEISILLKENQKGQMSAELAAFQDLGLSSPSSTVENEVEILKSRTLMTRVVEELGINLRVFSKGRIKETERYRDLPVSISPAPPLTTLAHEEFIINIEVKSDGSFDLLDEEGDVVDNHAFGEPISLPFGNALISLEDQGLNEGYEVMIIGRPVEKMASIYNRSLEIERVGNSSVLILRLTDPLRHRAEDVLNELVRQYNLDDVTDKKLVSENTAKFIEERMRILTSELTEVENVAAGFKLDNKLVDVSTQAELFLTSDSDNRKNIIETNLQLRLVQYVLDYIDGWQATKDLLPSNLGINEGALVQMIEGYNQLVLDRNRILGSSSEQNPVIRKMDEQLESLSDNLKSSLLNQKNALEIRLNELEKLASTIDAKIANVPGYEKEYREIQRQQQIKETLYLYLLQKREETAITLAVTVANAKIIDKALASSIPVSPNKRRLYLIAILFGFLAPTIFIYFRLLLDTKIHDHQDVDRLNVPYLGGIPRDTSNQSSLVINKSSRNGVSEAFRALRTNISFMLTEKNNDEGRVVFVTSSLSSEGKTYLSINLTSAMGLAHDRVILVGMDLRAPKIREYLGLEGHIGVSDYIVDTNMKLDDVIQSKPDELHFDVLTSGSVPPNPAELLMTKRAGDLMTELRNRYDYVIVDTAPVGMVTDTILMSKMADLTLFTIRANYSDKRMLPMVKSLHDGQKLVNMALVINDAKPHAGYKYGYGYHYGYGYGADKKPWWKYF